MSNLAQRLKAKYPNAKINFTTTDLRFSNHDYWANYVEKEAK